MHTFDKATLDSTGAFFFGELERLDQTLHMPLVAVTWGRDIDLREDVSMADETSSFTNSTFAAAGSLANSSGKNFIGKDSNAIAGVGVDIGKTASPLYLWAMEVGYSIPELLSAQQAGRPIDEQKYAGMQLKWQMDIDEMVYIGDSYLGKYGLINNTGAVTTGFVGYNAAGTYTQWIHKTADEILNDVNSLIVSTWQAAGFQICPGKLLLPPAQYAYIISQKVSSAGNISILKFLEDNCICNGLNGRKLDIQPLKWLTSRGTAAGSPSAATDRMVVYTQDKIRVRFPMVPLQRTPMEYRSLFNIVTYFGKLGVVETVYGETLGYADGI
jgi:hypothetical protein